MPKLTKLQIANKHIEQLINMYLLNHRLEHATQCCYAKQIPCTGTLCPECKNKYYKMRKEEMMEEYIVTKNSTQ
jgi:hypothetical protein